MCHNRLNSNVKLNNCFGVLALIPGGYGQHFIHQLFLKDPETQGLKQEQSDRFRVSFHIVVYTVYSEVNKGDAQLDPKLSIHLFGNAQYML